MSIADDNLQRDLPRVKAELESATQRYNYVLNAPRRLGYFEVKIGDIYQCPRCLIVDLGVVPLHPAPGNLLRCVMCPFEIKVSPDQA